MTKRLLLGVLLAVVLAAGGIAFAACVTTEEMEDTPEPTLPAATPQTTQGMLGCPDCVKAGDQLEVAAQDIQLGEDGKYYIPDRGDGCAYRQEGTGVWPDVILRAPGCEVFWTYDPATGQLRPTTP